MEGVACALVFALPVVVAVGIFAHFQAREKKAREAAWASYQQGLRELRSNPASADHKERALQLGRHYSNLVRDRSGVTVFDELALANDLSAACAGAAGPPAARPATATVEARLEHLSTLRERGLISEAEHESKREQILNEI